MSNQDVSTPWGPIREINSEDVILRQLSSGIWDQLWREITLRLEKTKTPAALEIPFDNSQTGKRARDAIKLRAHRAGVDMVINSRADGNGGRVLYIRRGPHWRKP